MKRERTLLEFAIGASMAVVPVLLAVLLFVAWLRPLDAAEGARDPDRHIAARQAAALATFEHAIVRRALVRHAPRDAPALIATNPACRSEWEGKARIADRARAWMGLPKTTRAARRSTRCS